MNTQTHALLNEPYFVDPHNGNMIFPESRIFYSRKEIKIMKTKTDKEKIELHNAKKYLAIFHGVVIEQEKLSEEVLAI